MHRDPVAAVEELLWFDTPVQLVSRVAYEPVELGGVTVDAGERVVAASSGCRCGHKRAAANSTGEELATALTEG